MERRNFICSLQWFLTVLPAVLCCVATVPGGTVTTTTAIAPTTTTVLTASTTTTVVTTTTTASACTSCTANQITFSPATGDGITIDAMFRVETADPVTGCSRLTAICNAAPGSFSFMEFNVNQGGPVENMDMTQLTEAPLECMNGMWYYMNQRVITAVKCSQAPMG